MNTSTSTNRSFSIAMPMPLTPPVPSSPPKPSAPDIPLNDFSRFFKTEDANTSLPYPTIRQHCYYLKLDVKRDWNAGYAMKDSTNFAQFASELESELRSLLAVDDTFKIQMVHAEKDKWSSRRILLTFTLQTIVNFAVEKFEALLKEHIAKDEKLLVTRAYLRDLKVRKMTSSEYEHMSNYGCNPCDVCDQVLKKHRRLDVNNPSSKADILCLLVVILSMALAITLMLLKFIK